MVVAAAVATFTAIASSRVVVPDCIDASGSALLDRRSAVATGPPAMAADYGRWSGALPLLPA
jgi:hypothetical protein